MRAQLAQHRNPVTHALICFKRHTRKGAGSVATTRSSPQKLDEAMLRRCVRSSAMIATLTHLDTLISSSSHTRKSAMLWLGCHSAKLAKLDEAMRAQLAMIGTLTHSSPLSATHSQGRVHSRLRRKSNRNPVTLISFKRHTRKRPLSRFDNAKYNEALEAMRAQLGDHRNPVTQARLRQRQARQARQARRVHGSRR